MSEAFKLTAAAKREEAQAKGSLAEMPASLNGKVLSASMQNGALICEAFQTKICPLPLEKESCSGRHACAVMHKAGRVCGGGIQHVNVMTRRSLRSKVHLELNNGQISLLA